MSNILIINAHQAYPFSEGRLNQTLMDRAATLLTAKGHQTRVVTMENDYDVQQEVENHKWADIIILQTPVFWMGVPWIFKKYMDEVYTAGMDGSLCTGDGRSSADPKKNYGTGGTVQGKKYMLSLTFNAPAEAFGNPDEYLFQGKSVDDLFFPIHMSFRFFGMTPLETFVCYDVLKNPDIENDLTRFDAHLERCF
ncbi:NAD(P)H-dependent oxidoreductase [Photobacterium sp. R1]